MRGFPQRYVIVDTETRSTRIKGSVPTEELRMRLGVALVQDTERRPASPAYELRFSEAVDFHRYMHEMPMSKEPIIVVAHNMGFDVRILEWFRFISLGYYTLMPHPSMPGAGRYKEPFAVLESPPFILRLFRPDGQQYILIDSYQWLGKPLADIGDMVGEPKAKMPAEDAPEGHWYSYCRQDCAVLRKAMMRLWDVLRSMNIETFEATPAAQAMLMYKMRYERKRIKRPADPDVLALERQAYYGGVSEAYWVGVREAPSYQLDVTSLYPYAMSQGAYPTEIAGICEDPARRPWPDSLDPRATTAEVWLETPDEPYPVRGSDQTLWVRGHVHTVLPGPELDRAVQAGHVRYVGRYITYKLDDLFSDWVRFMWSVRKTAQNGGDKFTDHLCKIMMNSLHGKFGQRIGDWQYVGKSMPDRTYGQGKVIGDTIECDTTYRVLAGHEYHRTASYDDPRGFVPIASWTSSYGRCIMRDLRTTAGDSQVLYQATDSLIVTGEGLGALQLGHAVGNGQIGTLRHEETYPWIQIEGLHYLTTDRRRVRPGTKRTATEVAPRTYEQQDWEACASGISQGNVSSVFIRTIVKHIRMGGARRRYLDDGSSEPWTIDNWEIDIDKQRSIPVRGV